jgi:tetratricopeptide (TPR) repeat protein
MTSKYAHFVLRLLAASIDSLLFLALNIYFWWMIAQSPDIQTLSYNLFLYLIIALFPLGFPYQILLTYWFGGTIGKLVTGIKITSVEGSGLSLKRVAFRQTIGYMFSWLFFGLGYWAILKDEKRQAWHDKTVGSVVLQINSLWFLGILSLAGLLWLNFYLGSQTVKTALANEPLKNQALSFFNELKADLGKSSGQLVSPQAMDKQKAIYSLIEQKNYAEAMKQAYTMLSESQTDLDKAFAYQIIGEVYISQQKFKEAEAPLMESLKLSDQFPVVYLSLAQVNIASKNYEEAKEYSQKASEFKDPSPDSFYWLGLSQFYLKDTKAAIENIQKALDMDPDNEFYKKELDFIKNPPPAQLTPAMSQADIDEALKYWDGELSYINHELATLQTYKQAGIDPAKVDRMIAIMNEQKSFTQYSRNKIINKQQFTLQDGEKAKNNAKLTEEYNQLTSSLN